jgi:hypothetical protein
MCTPIVGGTSSRNSPFARRQRCLWSSMHDAFGNVMKRCVLPSGETSQLLSGVVTDADLPDARDASPRARPVMELPEMLVSISTAAAIADPTNSALSPGAPSAILFLGRR